MTNIVLSTGINQLSDPVLKWHIDRLCEVRKSGGWGWKRDLFPEFHEQLNKCVLATMLHEQVVREEACRDLWTEMFWEVS